MKTLNLVNQRGECIQLWWEGPGVYGTDTSVRPHIIYRLVADDPADAEYYWETFEQACADLSTAC